jgi:hypothetical protein
MMEKDMSTKLNEKQKQLIALLKNSSDELVISMLMDLKDRSEFYFLNTLLEMINDENSEMLKNALIEFVSNIKLQAAVPILTEYINESYPSKDVISIITACWQSRLDFSKHLNPFFHILINGEYIIAFEAFTVIENSLEGLSPDELSNYMATVKRGISKSNRDKQLLLLEMISILDKTRRAAL